MPDFARETMSSQKWQLESGPQRDAGGSRTVAVFYDDDSDFRVEVGIATKKLLGFGRAETPVQKRERAIRILRLILEHYVAANGIKPGELVRINENDIDLDAVKLAVHD